MENRENPDLYLAVEGDEHDGYWIVGDDQGLGLLEAKCREARQVPAGGEASIDMPESDIVSVYLRERPVPDRRPTKFRESVNALVGVVILLLFVITLGRGCFALQQDVTRFVR